MLTVHDLRDRHCFICHQSEHYHYSTTDEDGWVHPCTCTLVAHNDCMLQYIDSLPEDEDAKCSQCNSQYYMAYQPSLPLVIIRLGDMLLDFGCGRILTGVILYKSVTAVGRSLNGLLMVYGASAIKFLFGEELFDHLLTDDTSNWSWMSSFFIPLAAARQLTSAHPFRVRHLLDWMAILPSEPPTFLRNELVRNAPTAALASTVPGANYRIFSTPFDILQPRWPPTGRQFFLILWVANVAHDLYRYRTVFTTAFFPGPLGICAEIIKTVSASLRRLRRNREPGAAPNNRVINLNLELQAGGNAEGQAPVAQPEVPQNENAAAAEAFLEAQSSPFLQALVVPVVSRCIGELLKRGAEHRPWAEHVLGIRPSAQAIGIRLTSDMLIDTSYWKRFTGWLWSDALDPVWIRSTLGLGLFYLVKTGVHSVHARMVAKEISSRRFKSRRFDGLDPRELDLIHPIT